MSVAAIDRLPLGYELLRVTQRDLATWGSASALVAGASLLAIYASVIWASTDEMPGSPPPTVMVEFAPEIMAPPQPDDLAPGPPMVERQQSTPVLAARQVVEDVETTSSIESVETTKTVEDATPVQVSEVTETEKPADVPDARDAKQEIASTAKEVVPDLTEIRQAEVVLPAAAAAPAPAPAPPTPSQAAVQPPSTPAPMTTALPKIDAKPAPVATAPEIVYARRADTVTPARWHIRVAAYLERFKHYPAAAQNRGERGIAYVRFKVDRNGRVLVSGITRSSGSAMLDEAALSMVRKASPIPPPPASLPDAGLVLTAPVRFHAK